MKKQLTSFVEKENKLITESDNNIKALNDKIS